MGDLHTRGETNLRLLRHAHTSRRPADWTYGPATRSQNGRADGSVVIDGRDCSACGGMDRGFSGGTAVLCNDAWSAIHHGREDGAEGVKKATQVNLIEWVDVKKGAKARSPKAEFGPVISLLYQSHSNITFQLTQMWYFNIWINICFIIHAVGFETE